MVAAVLPGAALCAGPQAVVCAGVAVAVVGVGLLAWGGAKLYDHIMRAEETADQDLDSTPDEGSCASCGDRTLPANPDELLGQGWQEEQTRAPNRRRFRNPETGEVLEFDKAQPGKPGWRGRDHYHRPNPDKTGDGDAYLDRYGNPVRDGSGPSHIPPGTPIGGGT